VASNFDGGSSASKGGNNTFVRTLLPQKPKIGRIGQRAGHAHPHVNITVEMRRHKRHARDAPFVKSHGVWTQDWHVWIYVSPRRRTYLFFETYVRILSYVIIIVR